MTNRAQAGTNRAEAGTNPPQAGTTWRREVIDGPLKEPLAAQYDTIKSEARGHPGSLYNASDYPSTLDGLFDLDVAYPTIEPQTL